MPRPTPPQGLLYNTFASCLHSGLLTTGRMVAATAFVIVWAALWLPPSYACLCLATGCLATLLASKCVGAWDIYVFFMFIMFMFLYVCFFFFLSLYPRVRCTRPPPHQEVGIWEVGGWGDCAPRSSKIP